VTRFNRQLFPVSGKPGSHCLVCESDSHRSDDFAVKIFYLECAAACQHSLMLRILIAIRTCNRVLRPPQAVNASSAGISIKVSLILMPQSLFNTSKMLVEPYHSGGITGEIT